jgi:hypothetical protein
MEVEHSSETLGFLRTTQNHDPEHTHCIHCCENLGSNIIFKITVRENLSYSKGDMQGWEGFQ